MSTRDSFMLSAWDIGPRSVPATTCTLPARMKAHRTENDSILEVTPIFMGIPFPSAIPGWLGFAVLRQQPGVLHRKNGGWREAYNHEHVAQSETASIWRSNQLSFSVN